MQVWGFGQAGGKGLTNVLSAMGHIPLGIGWDGSVVHPLRGMKEAAGVPGSRHGPCSALLVGVTGAGPGL